MMRAPNLRNFATMTSLTPSLTPSLLFSGPLLFHATYVFSCLLSWHGPRMVNVSMYTYIHSPSQFSNLRKPSTNKQFLDPPTYLWLPQVVCMILCACMTNSTSGRGGGGGVSQQHNSKINTTMVQTNRISCRFGLRSCRYQNHVVWNARYLEFCFLLVFPHISVLPNNFFLDACG